MLVNFWCWNLGGPKAYILKSGGAVAPLAPLVPPPMTYMHKLLMAERVQRAKPLLADVNWDLQVQLISRHMYGTPVALSQEIYGLYCCNVNYQP